MRKSSQREDKPIAFSNKNVDTNSTDRRLTENTNQENGIENYEINSSDILHTSNQVCHNTNSEEILRDVEFQRMCQEDERSQMMNELYNDSSTYHVNKKLKKEDKKKGFHATLSMLKQKKSN